MSFYTRTAWVLVAIVAILVASYLRPVVVHVAHPPAYVLKARGDVVYIKFSDVPPIARLPEPDTSISYYPESPYRTGPQAGTATSLPSSFYRGGSIVAY